MAPSKQNRQARSRKLRWQVLTWLVACAVVPLIVMALQGYHCARSAVISLESTHLISVLEARRARITDWFEERKADLQFISDYIRRRGGASGSAGGVDGESYRYLLDHVQSGILAFESLAVYDSSWRLDIASESSVHNDSELVSREFKAQLEKTTDVVVSPPHRHESGRVGIHLGVGILDDEGRTSGYVVAAALLSQRLYPILEDNSGLRASTKTYIVSSDGRFFSGPRPHIEVLSRGINFPDGFLDGGGRGAMPYQDCCGRKVLGMASPMPELGWILIAEVDQDEAFAWLRTLRQRAALTSAIVLGAVLLFGLAGSRMVARPFRQLQAVAGRIAEGSHAERVPPMGNAEADAVAETLNTMLDELALHARRLANAGALAAVGQLSSSVVHEMRNPLSSIKLNLTAMRDGFAAGSDDRELADIALREASRVEGMLNDLLAYGKPLQLCLSEVPLSSLLQRVVEHARGAVRERGLRMVTKWNGNEGIVLPVDEEQMLRALANLADNAVDFSPDGGTVEIAMTIPDDASRLVEIAVRDEGSGIREDSLEHVFEPFFTTRERGTGLGLANVRKIVECHGGTVSVSNRPEGGAVFTVRIPVVKEML